MYLKPKPSILQEKSKAFSARIIKMVKYLYKDKPLNPIHTQLLKSGTSVYANVKEAEFAQSPADFVHKLSIALKEANETDGWIDLLLESECITAAAHESIKKDCLEIVSMLVASINTTRKNHGLYT